MFRAIHHIATFKISTMVKATAPMFVLLASFALGLERVRLELVVVIGAMCMGVAVMVAGNGNAAASTDERTAFVTHTEYAIGLVCVCLAASMSGLRWALTQLLMVGHGLSDESGQSRSEARASSLLDLNRQETLFSLDDDDDDDVNDNDDEDRRRSGIVDAMEMSQRQATTTARSSTSRNRSRSASPHARIPITTDARHGKTVHHSSRAPYPPHLYTMFLLAPIMAVTLFLSSLAAEQPFAGGYALARDMDSTAASRFMLTITAGGILAFCMVLAELWMISLAGAVTMSVAGLVKELLTILVAALVFGGMCADLCRHVGRFVSACVHSILITVHAPDRLTPWSALGLLITVVAVAYYNVIKARQAKEG